MNIQTQNNEVSTLVTFDTETVSKIILEFLGNKESLKYTSLGKTFTIRLNDLEQFHRLLEQKLEHQKDIFAIHLSIDIGFQNDIHRTINGIESLLKFNDISNLEIETITLTWKVINKFTKNKSIETQNIELSFLTKNDEAILNITHTNQAWAIEIQNLFLTKINEICKEDSLLIKTYKKFNSYEKNFILIISLMFLTLMIFFTSQIDTNNPRAQDIALSNAILENFKRNSNKDELIISLALGNNFKSDQLSKIIYENGILEKESELNIEKAIHETPQKSARFIFISSIGLGFLIFLFPLITSRYIKYALSRLQTPSFIILTNYLETQFQNKFDKVNNWNFYSISLLFYGVISSLVAAFVWKLFQL
ncbi:hypothetical protein [Acinetobacter sp. 3657]|uniref:hypothetical protein n=1 Tax=Acinetobacter sp. 3657 TaxID=2817764 RepID=UPI00285AC2E2|nr:hypothetical protein [Prolinoborus sp. 3657]